MGYSVWDGVVIAENQNGQTTSYTYGLERISETIWDRGRFLVPQRKQQLNHTAHGARS